MTKNEELAMDLALEALESERPYLGPMPSKTVKAITAIKQARSAPVQEPVAFFYPGQGFYWAKPTKIIAPVTVDVKPLPLYTAPPAQPATEESSATQPVQEPVAWMYEDMMGLVGVRVQKEKPIVARPVTPLCLCTPPAAQRQWVGLETLIPEGWRFYTADFSMQATGKRNCGSVMLIRDEKGVAEWHKLPADLKESDDGPPLYLSGTGKTLQEAIEEASARAIEAKLKEKNT